MDLQDGLDFAAAATRGADAVGAPAVVALFAVTERWRGPAVETGRPVCRSSTRLNGRWTRLTPQQDRSLSFLDGGELTSKLGRCFRDLGMHQKAEHHLELSLSLLKPQRRITQALTKIVLTTTYVRLGELEPAWTASPAGDWAVALVAGRILLITPLGFGVPLFTLPRWSVSQQQGDRVTGEQIGQGDGF